MKVEIGHTRALDLADDGVGLHPTSAGEHITVVHAPADLSASEVVVSIEDAIRYHVADSSEVVWVRAEDPEVQKILARQFGTGKNQRPRTWGRKATT